MKKRTVHPARSKTWQGHFEEIEQRQKSPEKDLSPATLEGCLVKMCDSVSYTAKDLEDAIQLGIIKRSDIPQTILGSSNRQILQQAACDLVKMSLGKDCISFSEEIFESLKQLRNFNFERIYNYPALKVESVKIKDGYRQLFELISDNFKKLGKKSHLYKHFLHSKSKEYLEQTQGAQMVIDYIAGMTDRYFVSTLEQFVIPQMIRLGHVLHH